MTDLAFPTDFLWGAATAAHQIEGNNVNSDWWEREHRPGGAIQEPSGDAADSLHRYPEDIRLMSELGLTSYRFSIEWARIEPAKGRFSRAAALHYRRMIDLCRQHGLEPVVTLHHFTNPQWVAAEGGWRNPAVVEYFQRYVEYLLPTLDGVTWVCTINEPNMLAMAHDSQGATLDASSQPDPDPVVTENVIAAHHKARALLHRVPGIRVGWSIAGQAYHAVPGHEEAMAAYRYPREDVFLEAARDDDYIGVQAYLRTFIDDNGPVPVPEDAATTQMGWEYFPPALENATRHAWKLTDGTPVLVTENGIATADDSRRIDYTYDALSGLHKAMEDGICVQGYLHWSALDNYEWGSFAPTFGLIAWDPVTFERTPKPGAFWLGEVARTGRLLRPTVGAARSSLA
ncbi:glycoside hydrolase family 1 protein [Paenarthrobacter sp. NPDC089989]|uniref:glycoside hydrolase family 1 protein n=1 Tax=unclassified Paenarthrobacter TaxID=2634190 RepID=UPI00381FF11D